MTTHKAGFSEQVAHTKEDSFRFLFLVQTRQGFAGTAFLAVGGIFLNKENLPTGHDFYEQLAMQVAQMAQAATAMGLFDLVQAVLVVFMVQVLLQMRE